MAGVSPTQRSLKLLRDEGWIVAVVERWVPGANIRQDLFGFIDILGMKGDKMIAVQTTSGSNVAARIAKIKESPIAKVWSEYPSLRMVEVHGWSKRGPRGKRKVWTCNRIVL
jgi:hypothetical protein